MSPAFEVMEEYHFAPLERESVERGQKPAPEQGAIGSWAGESWTA